MQSDASIEEKRSAAVQIRNLPSFHCDVTTRNALRNSGLRAVINWGIIAGSSALVKKKTQ